MSTEIRRYYRVETEHGPRWAHQEGEHLAVLDGAPWEGPRLTGATLEIARLLAPATPSKILAIGRNYADHAKEMDNPVPEEPLIFSKPPSAVVGPGDVIRKPAWAGRVDHEAELALVIGHKVYDPPSPEASASAIFGLTCLNDVTARELQKKDGQFTRGKGFDTFCPIGPCLVSGLDFSDLEVVGRVNGAVRQRGRTRDLIFPLPYLVWACARVMTLLPGDIISTGTPAGVGPLQAGDRVEVEIEGVGVLVNTVA